MTESGVDRMQTDAVVEASSEAVLESVKRHTAWASLTFAQQRFLVAFGRSPIIRRASRAAGINPTTHYRWLERHEVYRDAWVYLKMLILTELEGEVFTRALAGPADPHSARLLILALRALAPERWSRGTECERCATERFKHMKTAQSPADPASGIAGCI